MLRRLTYALAAAAVALGFAIGLAGGYPAIAAQISEPPDTIPPSITAAVRDYYLKLETIDGEAISDRNYDGTVDTASLAPVVAEGPICQNEPPIQTGAVCLGLA